MKTLLILLAVLGLASVLLLLWLHAYGRRRAARLERVRDSQLKQFCITPKFDNGERHGP
jgi:hypothetical protein